MKKLFSKIIPLAYGAYFNLCSHFSLKKTTKKAFYLFCTNRKGHVLPHQKDFLNSAKKEVLIVQNHNIQTYHWPGKGETILLVHGWESNTFRWRNLLKRLQEDDYNIIAFDAPSHGNSSGKYLYVPLYSEALQAVITKYNPKQLIGHSLGGMTILYNEYRNKNIEVEKIVTIGSPSEFQKLMSHYQNMLKFNNKILNALDNYIFERFGFYINEFSTSEYVKTNTKKGLVLHDRFDKIAPYKFSIKVPKNWKGSTLITTEGLGHSMHQEGDNKQIIDFLKS